MGATLTLPLLCADLLCCLLQPEPFEFLQHKQELTLQRVASTAASRVARSFTRQHSALSSTHESFTNRQQILRAFSSMRTSSLGHAHMPMPAHDAGHDAGGSAAAVTSPRYSSGVGQLRQLSAKQLSLQLQRSVSITSDGRLVPDARWSAGGAEQQKDGLQALGCEQEFQQEVRCCTSCLEYPWTSCFDNCSHVSGL